MVFNFIDDFCLSDVTNPLSPSPIKGTKRKAQGGQSISYLNAGPKTKKRKLDPAYKLLREISTKHTAPFHMALGQLGARYYHNTKTNPELETLFKVIANGDNPMEAKIFDEQTSASIKGTLGLGQNLWDYLRARLQPHIFLTARSKLQAYTIKNNPPLDIFKNGVWINLGYALTTTLKEILELVEDYEPSLMSPNTLELNAFIVLKYDGSGSHAQMQGEDIHISTRNLILGMYISCICQLS